MNTKHEILKFTVTFICFLTIVGCGLKPITLNENKLTVVKREITNSTGGILSEVHLNNQESDGMAIIEDVKFETGTIEIDIQGENKPGQSFVGFAFNIQNDSTYEAIYFRPFNFQSQEKIRREHSMQYISQPTHTWRKLRTEHEGKYEAEFFSPPSPNDWFTVQLKIEEQSVTVIDKRSDKVLLTIDKRLTPIKSDKVALWTGYNSKGKFRNLKIAK